MNGENSNKTGNSFLYRYIGLATQIMASVAVSIFIGYKVDQWFHFSFPILVWVLPLFVIIAIIWQIIKDTSKTKDV